MTVEIITSLDRLVSIDEQWRQLATHIPVTPLQSPSWILTWWKHFGSGYLRVFAFWNEKRLAGLLPLFCHEWNEMRQLTLVGSGITDYLEPCVVPKLAPEIVQHLGSLLAADMSWDVCDWQDLRYDSPLLELTGDGLQVEALADTICSVARLPNAFEEYWNARSTDLRRNVGRYTRKAEAAGPLSFQVTCSADNGILSALMRLHEKRWQLRGESGMIVQNSSGGFLLDISQQFAELDILRLFSLQWQGETVAVILAFAGGETIYGYLTAFDPEFESFGFGRILLARCMRYAIENGYRQWDFLRGDEPYKSSWGAQSVLKRRLIIRRSPGTNLGIRPPCAGPRTSA